MPGLLLDSSVIVKWLLDEDDSDRAVALQRRYLAGDVALSYAELSLYEVANALHFSRMFEVAEIVEAMMAVQALGIPRLGFSSRALNRAIELAANYGTAIYDGYLVALAEEQDLTFVTADRKLLRRLSTFVFVTGLDAFPPPSA